MPMIKSYKIKMKTHSLFYRTPFKIYLKKHTTNLMMENGISMMKRKDNGLSKMMNLYKKYKK